MDALEAEFPEAVAEQEVDSLATDPAPPGVALTDAPFAPRWLRPGRERKSSLSTMAQSIVLPGLPNPSARG